MRSVRPAARVLALLALFVAVSILEADVALAARKNAPAGTLVPFKSDAELLKYLKRMRKAEPVPPADAAAAPADPAVAPSPPASVPLNLPPPPPPPASVVVPSPSYPRAAATISEKITNTQEAGVDEGDIVKMHGTTLVILRRGRLFTISTAGGELKAVDAIDAYPPGTDASGDWYDEMLVAGDRIVVIGYSYGRGGTEINRFHIDGKGRLRFDDAYHLRSNDYYSSRNYASRLIGTRLVTYSPLYLPFRDYLVGLPALRRWTGEAGDAGFKRIVSANHVYLPRQWLNDTGVEMSALHTVTSCDLTAEELNCNATSVLGPDGRTFYVSSHAVYVWVTDYDWFTPADRRHKSSLLYRLPLDGSAPSAIGVHGAPVDQFSFREDWEEGVLNVLTRSEGGGDAMWNPEFSEGAIALLRMPLSRFGDGSGRARRVYHRALPTLRGNDYAFQNRFVGNYLLYGTGNSWGPPDAAGSHLHITTVAGPSQNFRFRLKHGVDRIETMGFDALVVGGSAEDLHFQAVELTAGPRPQLGNVYVLKGAAQSETRSHAFFFRPEPRVDEADDTAGVLALPVARAGRAGAAQLFENSAAMLFLRRMKRDFTRLGELAANDNLVVEDACKASCVDWYGNARPIFLSDRTFALMGYELVEAELRERTIRELRRLNFTPEMRK
jgi:hypothetical protein